jgi:hypothetical protein
MHGVILCHFILKLLHVKKQNIKYELILDYVEDWTTTV